MEEMKKKETVLPEEIAKVIDKRLNRMEDNFIANGLHAFNVEVSVRKVEREVKNNNDVMCNMIKSFVELEKKLDKVIEGHQTIAIELPPYYLPCELSSFIGFSSTSASDAVMSNFIKNQIKEPFLNRLRPLIKKIKVYINYEDSFLKHIVEFWKFAFLAIPLVIIPFLTFFILLIYFMNKVGSKL